MATEKKTLSQIINEFASMQIDESMEMELKYKIEQAKALVDFSTSHNNIPISVLVYVAVGTNACKPHSFENGYKNGNGEFKAINITKAEKVFAYAELFVERYGERYYSNDKVVHFLCNYIAKGGTKAHLRTALANVSPTFNIAKAKTAKEIGKALFNDTADFSNGGYFNGMKPIPKEKKEEKPSVQVVAEEINPNGYKKDKNGFWRDSKGHFVKAPKEKTIEEMINAIF